jgi:hypothetical protein
MSRVPFLVFASAFRRIARSPALEFPQHSDGNLVFALHRSPPFIDAALDLLGHKIGIDRIGKRVLARNLFLPVEPQDVLIHRDHALGAAGVDGVVDLVSPALAIMLEMPG